MSPYVWISIQFESDRRYDSEKAALGVAFLPYRREDEKSPIGKENERRAQAKLSSTQTTKPKPKGRAKEESGIAELARIFPNERRTNPGANEVGSWSTAGIYLYVYIANTYTFSVKSI